MAEVDGNDDWRASVQTVADIVRSALGPFGANKLIVQGDGTVTTTANVTEILERLEIENPAVDLLGQAATDFDDFHHDGAATVVALAAALLNAANDLRDQGLHPTTIERGFGMGLDAAITSLEDTALPVDRVGFAAVARTALTRTRDPHVRDQVADSLEEMAVTLTERHGTSALREHTRVVARLGGAPSETELVPGVVLDTSPVDEAMPRTCPDAGVALLSSTIDMRTVGSETDRTADVDLRLDADSFEDRAAIGEWERAEFRNRLEAAVSAGCNVIITRRSVNDRVKTVLANHGILALQRVDEVDMKHLAEMTGAIVVPHLDHIDTGSLGRADVSIRREAGRDMAFVETEGRESVYTVFCRAPDPRAISAFERTVEAALAAIAAATEDGVVPGGGAAEFIGATAAREHARSIGRREQIAADAVGDALLAVPRTLARNGGLPVQSAIAEMRAGTKSGTPIGVDAFDGSLRNMLEPDPLVDPLSTKRHAWSAAVDLAVKLVRIDDWLHAPDLEPDDGDEGEESIPPG